MSTVGRPDRQRTSALVIALRTGFLLGAGGVGAYQLIRYWTRGEARRPLTSAEILQLGIGFAVVFVLTLVLVGLSRRRDRG